MGWRILYIEESESVSLYLDNVKIKKGSNEYTFPLSDISLLLIDNYKIQISVHLINACSSRNIPIVSCGDNHHPLCITLPLSGHFESSYMFLRQLNWTDNQKSIYWTKLVEQKIFNQLQVLKLINNDKVSISLLNDYALSVENNDKTNREGLAAKVYFHSLFGRNFSRNEDNVINACLNYGYSLIRAMISRTLVAKGLNTQLGIFHKGHQNVFNLADDVIEIFRPIIDYYVYSNFLAEKIFTKEIRMKILDIFGYKLEVQGEKITICHAIEKFIDNMIGYFNDDKNIDMLKLIPVLYDL